MPQTTGATSGANFQIRISLDGSTWQDISGTANNITGVEATRMTGEAYTARGDYAIVTQGKREPMEPQVRIVYSESPSEGFRQVLTAFENNQKIWLDYSPAGGNAGDMRFSTPVAVPISKLVYPEVDAGNAEPIMCGFSFKAPYMTSQVIN